MQARKGTQGIPPRLPQVAIGGSERLVQPCLSTHRSPTCHDKPAPFLLQTPVSPSLKPQPGSTTVPHWLPSTAPASLQLPHWHTHPEQASPRQDRDLSHCPTTASKSCSSPWERGRRTGFGAGGGEAQSHPDLSPSRSLGQASLHHPKTETRRVRGHSPGQSLEPPSRPGAALQGTAEQRFPSSKRGKEPLHPTPPVSPSHSPGPRASPSQPKQARLPINKDEEAPSHRDPFSFFSRTLSQWAEGQGYSKRPSAGVLIAPAENAARGAAEPISRSLPCRWFKPSHGGPSVTSIS